MSFQWPHFGDLKVYQCNNTQLFYQNYTSLLSNSLASTKTWSRGYNVCWNHWFDSGIWATVSEPEHVVFPVMKPSCACAAPTWPKPRAAHRAPHYTRERKFTQPKPTDSIADMTPSPGEGRLAPGMCPHCRINPLPMQVPEHTSRKAKWGPVVSRLSVGSPPQKPQLSCTYQLPLGQ